MTWYELDRARLVLEHLRVSHKYPQFALKRSENGGLYWIGDLMVEVGDIKPEPLQLRIEYPEAFPAEYPIAIVLKPTLPDEHVGHKWHRWPSSGGLCYVNPKDWLLGTTADAVISKCEEWYFNYIAFTGGLINEMPDLGRATLK